MVQNVNKLRFLLLQNLPLLGPLFKDIGKSKNAEKQGTKRSLSRPAFGQPQVYMKQRGKNKDKANRCLIKTWCPETLGFYCNLP